MDEHKQKTFFGYKFCHFFLLMIIFAFLGFISESIFKLLTRGYIDSSHHFFPATFTYSIIILLLFTALGEPDKVRFFGRYPFKTQNKKNKALSNLLWCATLAAAVFFGEAIVGSCNYYIAGAVIWDYNSIPLSVKFFGCPYAFTSLPTTLAFTLAGWLFMKFLFKPVMRLLQKVPVKAAIAVDAVLGALLIGDYIFTLIYTQAYAHAPYYWAVNFNFSPPAIYTNLKIFPWQN